MDKIEYTTNKIAHLIGIFYYKKISSSFYPASDLLTNESVF